MQCLDPHSLEEYFGRLSLGQEEDVLSLTYNGSDDSDEEDDDNGPSLFEMYQEHPANAFQRPIIYRVIDSDSPMPAPDGTLYARLYPIPAVESVTISEMERFVRNQAWWSSRASTPLISATPDLLRALNEAGRRVASGKMEVTIILIDAWSLPSGSYIDCNALRRKCGYLEESKYETEVLIWGAIPGRSIFARWTWPDLERSGLFDILPSLNQPKPGRTVAELRTDITGDRDCFSPSAVATAVVSLGMVPSSFSSKQVFEFLLGQVMGYRVPKNVMTIEELLLIQFRSKIDEFDRTAYKLAVSAGEKKLAAYFKQGYAEDINQFQPACDPFGRQGTQKYRRRWRKSWASRIRDLFCPQFETWWVRREESDLSDWEAQEMRDHESNGLEGWTGQIGG